jgi:hypothetical protein
VSDLKRYEEELAQRLKKLSSPNKILVWEKIEKLLDEDDDGTTVPPSPDRRNNLWLLLTLFALLILGSSAYYFIHSSKNNGIKERDNKAVAAISQYHSEKNNCKTVGQSQNAFIKDNTNNLTQTSSSKTSVLVNDAAKKSKYFIQKMPSRQEKSNAGINTTKNNIGSIKEKESPNKPIIINTKGKINGNVTSPTEEDDLADKTNLNKESSLRDTTKYTLLKKDQPMALVKSAAKKDTSIKKPLLKMTEDSSIIKKKKNDNTKKKLYFAVGIAVQQPIQLNYDLVYPSDSYTLTSSITDYLPSVYARLYNAKKWFIQSEFKYAAPQNIDEFIYRQTVEQEVFKDIVTSYTLKKVYFSQVSIGFHYFVVPNLSIGSGIIYNIFSGADIQEDVHQKQYESANDLLLGSTAITDKQDPNFSSYIKTNFQWLLETQYKWRHFLIGLRYAAGLQPYIKYTDPFSGMAAQKNDNSLNIFIRYELWKSKKVSK